LAGSNTQQRRVTIRGVEVKKRKKRAKKRQLSTHATAEEPLSQLGFGIVAYTGMLYAMIFIFGLFSLMLIPTFSMYANGTQYEG